MRKGFTANNLVTSMWGKRKYKFALVVKVVIIKHEAS
jgi:hypothetical protein